METMETNEEIRVLTTEDMVGAIVDEGGTDDVIQGWKRYKISLHWLSPILGTTPADPKTLVTWRGLAAAKGDRDKIVVMDETDEHPTPIAVEDGVSLELSEERQGHTAFWRDGDGKPCIMSYHFRGFLINSVTVLKEDFDFRSTRKNKESGEMKKADPVRLLRNNMRITPFSQPLGERIDGLFGRTVRGMTMQGPRISINVSEVVLKPWPCEFVLDVRDVTGWNIDKISSLLEYGRVEGISQWRSGGWGRFRYEIEEMG